jgi:hypothetical protein
VDRVDQKVVDRVDQKVVDRVDQKVADRVDQKVVDRVDQKVVDRVLVVNPWHRHLPQTPNACSIMPWSSTRITMGCSAKMN